MMMIMMMMMSFFVLSETKIGAKLHIPLGEERESVRAGHRGQEFWTIVGTMNAKASCLRR
jgi:hypothetical protein